MKSGFIGIIGRPNVGKSTLLNSILGEKISITTDKPQTTRNTIRGIYTDLSSAEECERVQMVFLDTPGIHKPKNKLGNFMTTGALRTLNEVDAILFVIDDPGEPGAGDRRILDLLQEVDTPVFALINKIDEMDPNEFKHIFDHYQSLDMFQKVIPISALKGDNIDLLLKELADILPEGPMYFDADSITDHPERFVVAEIIREKALMYLHEEVPHGIAVEIELFEEKKSLTKITASIICERSAHKKIIIGKGGKKIKGIGKAAREEIEALLGTKVFLELWVKVRENWRNNDNILLNLGYKDR